MTEILSTSQINQAVCYATPGMGIAENALLGWADIFRKGYLMFRRAYLITNNPISFAAGSALNLALGQNDTLMQIARITLGIISILRCGEDLHKLCDLKKKCSRIIKGKEYIPIKGDRFNITGSTSKANPQFLDEFRYKHKMRMERIAYLITTIGQMAVVFGELMLHTGDAYVAFNEDCASEVVIHSLDLWNELSSDKSYLVQQLKKNEAFNDWVLGRMNTKTSLCTQVLMGLIAVPSQVRGALPDIRDIAQGVTDLADEIALDFKQNIQDCQTLWRQMQGIDPLVHATDTGNSEATRWIKPPKRIIIDK